MNKFLIYQCVDQSKELDEGQNLEQHSHGNYKGNVVILSNLLSNDIFLFFPISDDNAVILNQILKSKSDKNAIDSLGVYKVMMESILAGNRYISGILMDLEYSTELKEDIITVRVMISDSAGLIDSVIKVNFVHAIMLGAITNSEIMVTDSLLFKLVPPEENDEDEDEEDDDDEDDEGVDNTPPALSKDKFPVDEGILDIAKKIMGGKIK